MIKGWAPTKYGAGSASGSYRATAVGSLRFGETAAPLRRMSNSAGPAAAIELMMAEKEQHRQQMALVTQWINQYGQAGSGRLERHELARLLAKHCGDKKAV